MKLIAVFQHILEGLKSLLPFWNLQSSILISLSLQVILHILAPVRKWTKRKSLIFVIWASYLPSDWIATIATITILKIRSSKAANVRQSTIGSDDFMPMWASFLLLHLGGPDKISSFAIADNQLSLRHLASLIYQVFSTAYIIYLSFPVDKMRISMVALFLAATINYSERTRALFLGSLDRFGSSVLPKTNPGLDHEESARIYAATSSVDVPSSEEEKPTKSAAYVKASEEKGQIIQSETELVEGAYRLFQSFKGLLAGHRLGSSVRVASRRYFITLTAEQAFRLVAYERSFIYGVLHTKVVLFHGVSSYVLLCICIILLLVAFFEFRSMERQYRADYEPQVRLSYILFIVTLGSEAINVVLFLCSGWGIIKLKFRWGKFFMKFILLRERWSMSYYRYDMMRYCLYRPEWLRKLGEFAILKELLDKIYDWYYSNSHGVGVELQEFIFEQVKMKGIAAETLQAGIDVCERRGEGPLREEKYNHLQ